MHDCISVQKLFQTNYLTVPLYMHAGIFIINQLNNFTRYNKFVNRQIIYC